MTSEIRRRIHAFRNALVLAADTRSHACFHMGRWHLYDERERREYGVRKRQERSRTGTKIGSADRG